MESNPPTKPDIQSRACLETLVNAFYLRVQQDDVLGFIFKDIAQTDWAHHLPRMYDFWEKVIFRTGPFQGNPLAVHAALVGRTTMGKAQFDRWLHHFHATVDDLFSGPRAAHVKNCAADMAAVIHRKINHLPDPVSLMPTPPSSVTEPA